MKIDNKSKRVLSMLMTLFLIMGLFMGFGTTAKAEPTTTDLSSVDISGIIMPDAVQGPKFNAAVPEGAKYHIATDAEMAALNWTEYKHGVNWWSETDIYFDLIDKFEAGKNYSAVVVLIADPGYTFSDGMTASINGSKDNCLNARIHGSGDLVIIHSIYWTATATDLSSVDISGIIMPDAVQGPKFNAAVPEGAKYHIATDAEMAALNWAEYKHGVNWWSETGIYIELIDKFEAGKNYSAVVVLIADPGYTFSDGMTASINGSKDNCRNARIQGSGDAVIIDSIYWTATATGGLGEIESVNLTMPIPKTGNKSSIGATTTESGYSVATTDWEVIDEVFKPDTVYTAIITLEATGVDRFTNRTQFFVNGENAKLVAPNPIQGSVREVTLTFTFPKTEAAHICEGTKISKQEATFTETGVQEHYECSCGKIYSDASCRAEITNPDTTVIPMKKYEIIEGMNEKFIKKAGNTLVFKANGPKKDCTGIKIDGKIVDPAYYTLESGSTIVTLKSEYLEKLSVGDHNIVVLYGDREEAATKFIITVTSAPGGGTTPHTHTYSEWKTTKAATSTAEGSKERNCTVCGYKETASIPKTTGGSTGGNTGGTTGNTGSPKTGDNSNMILWLSLMCIAGIGLVGTGAYSRKKKRQR